MPDTTVYVQQLAERELANRRSAFNPDDPSHLGPYRHVAIGTDGTVTIVTRDLDRYRAAWMRVRKAERKETGK